MMKLLWLLQEKQAIKAAFNVNYEEITDVAPGHALIIEKNGDSNEMPILKPKEMKACSFERIYFSRGTDPEIYKERKNLDAY